MGGEPMAASAGTWWICSAAPAPPRAEAAWRHNASLPRRAGDGACSYHLVEASKMKYKTWGSVFRQPRRRPGRSVTSGVVLVAALALLFGAVRPAGAAEILVNGNFETGTFAGWTVADDNSPFGVGGTFFISTPGAPTPATGFATAPNPAGGAFYAVSDSDFPGAHALLQDFTVPAGQSVFLSYQMFVNDQSGLGPIVDPTGLDPTTGGTFNDNQHARVDILRGGASDFSTAAGDVIANLYLGVDPDATVPNPF